MKPLIFVPKIAYTQAQLYDSAYAISV